MWNQYVALFNYNLKKKMASFVAVHFMVMRQKRGLLTNVTKNAEGQKILYATKPLQQQRIETRADGVNIPSDIPNSRCIIVIVLAAGDKKGKWTNRLVLLFGARKPLLHLRVYLFRLHYIST